MRSPVRLHSGEVIFVERNERSNSQYLPTYLPTYVKRDEQAQTMINIKIVRRAFVVAQLAEWLLSIPDDLGSNTAVINIYKERLFAVDRVETLK